jgi:hypothetical protein
LAAIVGALLCGVPAARADDVISPFIDSQTNAVIYVDLSNLDMDQLAAWHNKAIATIADPDQRARAQKDADQSTAQGKKWVSDFRNAGGKDLYIVVSLAGMMQRTAVGVVAPLNGADPAALGKAFVPNPPPSADPTDPSAAQVARMRPQTAVIGNMLVYSTGAGIDKFKAPSSEPRQDILDGLAAGGQNQLRLSLTPSNLKDNPFFKMLAGAIMSAGQPPQPGQPPQQSTLFSEPQWDSVTFVSVALSLPPKESAGCTIQCKDADSASAMSDLINQKIQSAKDSATKNGNMSADDFAKLAAAAKPTVSGSQVIITIDQDTIDNVLGPMMARMAGRNQAGPAPAPAGPPPSDNGM